MATSPVANRSAPTRVAASRAPSRLPDRPKSRDRTAAAPVSDRVVRPALSRRSQSGPCRSTCDAGDDIGRCRRLGARGGILGPYALYKTVLYRDMAVDSVDEVGLIKVRRGARQLYSAAWTKGQIAWHRGLPHSFMLREFRRLLLGQFEGIIHCKIGSYEDIVLSWPCRPGSCSGSTGTVLAGSPHSLRKGILLVAVPTLDGNNNVARQSQ